MFMFIAVCWATVLIPLAFYVKRILRKSDLIVANAESRQSELGPHFRLVETEDDLWFERQVESGGQTFAIRLSPEVEFAKRSLPFANDIADHSAVFLDALHAFLEDAGVRNDNLKRDLQNLKIDTISFEYSLDPSMGSVNFRELESCIWWVCLYRQSRFYDISGA